jgi:hypothetical protein
MGITLVPSRRSARLGADADRPDGAGAAVSTARTVTGKQRNFRSTSSLCVQNLAAEVREPIHIGTDPALVKQTMRRDTHVA